MLTKVSLSSDYMSKIQHLRIVCGVFSIANIEKEYQTNF